MVDVNQLGGNRGVSMNLNTSTTTVRRAANNSFSSHIRRGISGAGQAVSAGLSVAAPVIPGSAVISAAVNGAAQGLGRSVGVQGGAQFSASNPASFGASGPDYINGQASGGGLPNGQQDMVDRMSKVQEMGAAFNLQYLELQQTMQDENRRFTTLSNVMKTKHDTAKSSIQNVR